jgi:hypothetical protein
MRRKGPPERTLVTRIFRSRPSERSRGPGFRDLPSVAVLAALLLAPAFLPGPAATARSPTGPQVQSTMDSPVLTLVPTPEFGNAPLTVNASVTVSGGVAPYRLSLCFGTIDHTSPPPNCGVGNASWSGSTPAVFSHQYLSAGNFSVIAVLTDARGAGVGSTALVVVTDRIALAANAVELTGSGPAPLRSTFNESVAGGTPPITLQWTFGDGSSGSELPGVPVEHVYTSPGVYVPQLTVSDGAGHQTVRTLPAITVSSAPNGGSPSGGEVPPAELVGAFLLAAVVAAAGVRLGLARRWRREGDELIARLQDRPPDPRRPPRSP